MHRGIDNNTNGTRVDHSRMFTIWLQTQVTEGLTPMAKPS